MYLAGHSALRMSALPKQGVCFQQQMPAGLRNTALQYAAPQHTESFLLKSEMKFFLV